MSKKIISILLFLVAGVLSAYIFQLYISPDPDMYAFYPGLIFIGTTFIVLMIWKIPFKVFDWLSFLLSMYALYLVVFYRRISHLRNGFTHNVRLGGCPVVLGY